FGYKAVNEDIAAEVLRQIRDDDEPMVMLHDYHLYTAPALIRAQRPDAFLHHFVHIPWSQPDSWRVLPARWREENYRGMLANVIDAVARYNHCDLLMVNSVFDGMNLVAKEAPIVNTRSGVLMLSENTGSHEELADCALSVNPFDIQEQADTIYRALTMDPEERRVRAGRLREVILSRDPGDWVDEQLSDIRLKRSERA